MRSASVRKRILVVDEHPLVRRGLKALIDAEPDLVVCAEAAARDEALAAERPDLAAVDPSLGRGDGFDMIRDIRSRHEGLPVLVLATHDTPEYVRRAVEAGAGGCVAKGESTETLLSAIRAVLRPMGDSPIRKKVYCPDAAMGATVQVFVRHDNG